MKKVKINLNKSKYAVSKSFSILIYILGLVSIIFGIFLSVNDFIHELWIRIVVAILVYVAIFIIVFLIYYFWNKVSIKHNKLKVSIIKDDILKEKNLLENELLVFAVDTDYTMDFKIDHKINPRSLQGQFIEKYGDTVQFSSEGSSSILIKEIKFSLSNKKFPAFLIPLTEIKEEENYVAKLNKDILFLFKEAIKKIDGSKYKTIILPIIGSGQTTPTNSEHLSDKTNLICLWITLFKIYYRKNKELNLNFFVTENDWYDLRFLEIK